MLGCLMVLAVLLILQKIIPVHSIKRLEVQFINRQETLAFINDSLPKTTSRC